MWDTRDLWSWYDTGFWKAFFQLRQGPREEEEHRDAIIAWFGKLASSIPFLCLAGYTDNNEHNNTIRIGRHR